jgi:hypothetical protein
MALLFLYLDILFLCNFNIKIVCRNPTLRASVRMRLALPKVGSWSLPGLLQLQSSTIESKTPRLEILFIPLERHWSVDVENGLAWAIWTSIAQVMGKRRVGNQIVSLTPDHKKSGINPIPVCADGVWHTVWKLLRRATSLLQTSSQSKV